jgi:hypothetical protein
VACGKGELTNACRAISLCDPLSGGMPVNHWRDVIVPEKQGSVRAIDDGSPQLGRQALAKLKLRSPTKAFFPRDVAILRAHSHLRDAGVQSFVHDAGRHGRSSDVPPRKKVSSVTHARSTG